MMSNPSTQTTFPKMTVRCAEKKYRKRGDNDAIDVELTVHYKSISLLAVDEIAHSSFFFFLNIYYAR